MPNVIKIALPGYDVFTDTDPNHFALYVDNSVDYVLIKEQSKGSLSVNNNSTGEITHGLGYIPFCIVFLDNGDGSFTKLFGMDASSVTGVAGWKVDTNKLYLTNVSGSIKTFNYYIFYDDLT